MRIELESNVGLCGLKISGLLKENAIEKLAQKFMGYLTWHDGASKVFGGGKKAKFSRESPYSEELASHAKTCLLEIYSPFFEDISIESFAHAKMSEEEKFLKFCKSLGMSEVQAAAGWKTAQAASAEKPAEEPEKVVLE